jgi:hypothetical protein
MLVKVVFREVPTLVTAAIIATAIRAAIRPYSMAVAPPSSFPNRESKPHMLASYESCCS